MAQSVLSLMRGGIFIPPHLNLKEKSGGYLSKVTLTVIFIAFAAYLIFQGIKSFQLRSLNTGLKRRDVDMVERIAQMTLSRKLLGEYVCDLYELRVYYIAKETEKFEKMLRKMLERTYRDGTDKKSFLETYFHTFLIKGNQKYADWILEEIKKTEDAAFIRYNEWSYEVMLKKNSSLIAEMEEGINSKQYYGFALGAILFMVAKQYAYLQDKKNAVIYYQSAKACFHPKSVYMPVVDKCLKEAEAEA